MPPSPWSARARAAIATGAAFGGWMVLTSLAMSAAFIREQTGTPPDPLNPVTLGIAAWTVVCAAALATLLATVGGRLLDRRLLHVLPAPFVALALSILLSPFPVKWPGQP